MIEPGGAYSTKNAEISERERKIIEFSKCKSFSGKFQKFWEQNRMLVLQERVIGKRKKKWRVAWGEIALIFRTTLSRWKRRGNCWEENLDRISYTSRIYRRHFS